MLASEPMTNGQRPVNICHARYPQSVADQLDLLYLHCFHHYFADAGATAFVKAVMHRLTTASKALQVTGLKFARFSR